MTRKHPALIAAPRLLVAAVASALALEMPARAADPVIDPMRPWNGPVASAPTQGGRDILNEAQRGPSITQRFNLPQLSGPLPLEPTLPQIFRGGGQLAAPPALPQSADAALRRAR